MGKPRTVSHLYDPRQGDAPIRAERLRLGREPFEPARTNCFSIYFIESGKGTFWADAAQFPFAEQSLIFFVPYQHVRLDPSKATRAMVLQFHANFLCVETFHAEVGCSGILFNDPYGSPAVPLDEGSHTQIADLIQRIDNEQSADALASGEVMLAYLKVLLILATRQKGASSNACVPGVADARHPLLVQLRELIEQHYCTLHSPADYATRLHVTAKTLGRIVREHLGTTPSDLIRNRILIHAKWQLLHTLRPVKEISRELGFTDELYFSRLFKKATGCSPTFFREFETEIRGGSNLSMFIDRAPILPTAVPSDT